MASKHYYTIFLFLIIPVINAATPLTMPPIDLVTRPYKTVISPPYIMVRVVSSLYGTEDALFYIVPPHSLHEGSITTEYRTTDLYGRIFGQPCTTVYWDKHIYPSHVNSHISIYTTTSVLSLASFRDMSTSRMCEFSIHELLDFISHLKLYKSLSITFYNQGILEVVVSTVKGNKRLLGRVPVIQIYTTSKQLENDHFKVDGPHRQEDIFDAVDKMAIHHKAIVDNVYSHGCIDLRLDPDKLEATNRRQYYGAKNDTKAANLLALIAGFCDGYLQLASL